MYHKRSSLTESRRPSTGHFSDEWTELCAAAFNIRAAKSQIKFGTFMIIMFCPQKTHRRTHPSTRNRMCTLCTARVSVRVLILTRQRNRETSCRASREYLLDPNVKVHSCICKWSSLFRITIIPWQVISCYLTVVRFMVPRRGDQQQQQQMNDKSRRQSSLCRWFRQSLINRYQFSAQYPPIKDTKDWW